MFSSFDAYAADQEWSPSHLFDELDFVSTKKSGCDTFGLS